MATIDVNNRAAAYLRVSTREQHEQHQLPNIIRQATNDGYVIPEHFIFRDQVSGLKNESEREGLNNLLKLTKDDIDIPWKNDLSITG